VTHADPARLQQVFWNLIKNGIKFTPEGGTITARLAAWDVDGVVRVEVSDDGVGIDPVVLPRIFDAFEQGDTDVTRLFGGLGLGLAITKGLVELHRGTITAFSAGRNLGSTFTVTLPAIAAPEGLVQTTASSPVPHAPLSAPTRILVVEDHEETRRVLVRLLRSKGHVVFACGTVQEALDVAAREVVDLVVSDLGLPDGTGHELMSTVATRHRLPGIALSGYGMEEDLRRSREAGFLEHLTKPVDLGRLDQAIRRAVGTGRDSG
jgi:CheY-like chemotaxis protein